MGTCSSKYIAMVVRVYRKSSRKVFGPKIKRRAIVRKGLRDRRQTVDGGDAGGV